MVVEMYPICFFLSWIVNYAFLLNLVAYFEGEYFTCKRPFQIYNTANLPIKTSC